VLPTKTLFDSAKMGRLAQLLPQLQRDGHRVLLFSQYTSMLDLLERFIGEEEGGLGLKYLRLDGSTQQEQRQVRSPPPPRPRHLAPPPRHQLAPPLRPPPENDAPLVADDDR
jgi:hypothetical protein